MLMGKLTKERMQVSVVKWFENDGLAQDICAALDELQTANNGFYFASPIPENTKLVLTFGPWGRLLKVAAQLRNLPAKERPLWVHWNLENPPDPAIPWPILSRLAAARAWLDRLNDKEQRLPPTMQKLARAEGIHKRLIKFRYLGEYYYAFDQGILDTLADTSLMFTR
jgi:hypothetical protein